MDSLVLLCARRVVTQWHRRTLRSLRALPSDLYPLLFQLAFLDGRALVLRHLVATWPFPVLNLQRLVEHQELLPSDTWIDCIDNIIKAVVAQLRWVLIQPGHHYSLRTLDMTGLPDSLSCRTLTEMTVINWWSTTTALAKACVVVSKYQQNIQRLRSIWHEGCSRAATATAAPQPAGVDVHADLCVDSSSYRILRDVLETGATGLLRLKCREFKAGNIVASEIVTLLESLDPSCLRRVDLRFNNLELTELSEILPHLSRFPELHSLKLQNSNVEEQAVMLESSQPSRNLLQTLSFHAPALKRLDLKGLDVSQGLLEPLRLLLEETSASLLHLDLRECRMINSHLAALLPTLLRCSRLRFLGLHGNPLSTVALKDLLQKILQLPDLHLVVFPFPVDCYRLARLESRFDFVTDEELLSAATAEFFQISLNSRRTNLEWTYNPEGHDSLD